MPKTILVTGGAGFIGSHLIDYLREESYKVLCIDNLSLGREENIKHHERDSGFRFIKMDLLNKKGLNEVFEKDKIDCVFHLAANSDIQKGRENLEIDLKNTFMTTFNILDCMKKNGIPQIVFASSSAIYGELDKPLSEDTGPLFPISFYGAAKLCSEAYISAFCGNSNIQAWILRFPNVVGERATHGVVFDFINKLKKNPKELTILGNGKQKKPYMYVRDLIEGIVFARKNSDKKINCFNLGTDSLVTVHRIAEIVIEEMGLENVKLRFTGGDRGWIGDVPRFKYNLSKIHKLGWKAELSSEEAVRKAARALLNKKS